MGGMMAGRFKHVPDGVELRYSKEFRASSDGGVIKGHAATFNDPYPLQAGVWEQIAPTAFDGVLDGDTAALFNHDTNYPLGRTSATPPTLRLSTDQTGLMVEIDLPKSAAMVHEAIQRGDVKQMSFGFTVAKDGETWDSTSKGELRTITKVARLWDVSPVTFPANPNTDVALRSLDAWRSEGRPRSVSTPRGPRHTRESCQGRSRRTTLPPDHVRRIVLESRDPVRRSIFGAAVHEAGHAAAALALGAGVEVVELYWSPEGNGSYRAAGGRCRQRRVLDRRSQAIIALAGEAARETSRYLTEGPGLGRRMSYHSDMTYAAACAVLLRDADMKSLVAEAHRIVGQSLGVVDLISEWLLSEGRVDGCELERELQRNGYRLDMAS